MAMPKFLKDKIGSAADSSTDSTEESSTEESSTEESSTEGKPSKGKPAGKANPLMKWAEKRGE